MAIWARTQVKGPNDVGAVGIFPESDRRERHSRFWLLTITILAVFWVGAILLCAFEVPDAPFESLVWEGVLVRNIAIAATAVVTIVALVWRRWIVAVIISALGIAAGFGAMSLAELQTIDNLSELLQAESAVHGDLVHISQSFIDDGSHLAVSLPGSLRPLSRDDTVEVIGAKPTLYVSVWENWRDEGGGGFLYTEDPEVTLPVGPGYSVHPSIDLGDGWWYAEGA